jgi:hypothetical protein
VGELLNDYGTNVTTAQGFANALNTNNATANVVNNVVNSELYYIPPSLLNGYNTAFENYSKFQSHENFDDTENSATRMFRCFKLAAFVSLWVSWAGAATPPEPNFYARREYGENQGCAGQTQFAIGDVNGDGIPDIFCTDGQFLFGKGNGTFVLGPENSALSSPEAALVDLNGDGNLDLLGLNMVPSGWGFHTQFGNGKGGFGPTTFYPIADESSYYIAVGDLTETVRSTPRPGFARRI